MMKPHLSRSRWLLLVCLPMVAGLPVHAQPAAATTPTVSASPSPAGACPALLNRSALRLQDEKPQNLCQYAGKVVLVVNTASFCGFTPQYEGLETLYSRYRERGLVVLGFPSNDLNQESGSNRQIADFCEGTFGVKFPMFTKTAVSGARGQAADPLFADLRRITGKAPGWNFHKYLIARDGQRVQSFSSTVEPTGQVLVAEIEKLLSAK